MKPSVGRIVATLLSVSALYSCGGGIDGLQLVNGGVTGTGVTKGRITSFGSIFVNGVEFDVSNASFLRDGESSRESDYRVGEFVIINGSVNKDGVTGNAKNVIFTDSLEGQLSKATVDGETIEVLGQLIKMDKLVVFHGFKVLDELRVGNILEISGFRDSNGVITATSIQLKQTSFINGSSENEIKGRVSDVNQVLKTFSINGLTVDYSSAELKGLDTLIAGQYVEVKSNTEIVGGILKAIKVELEKEFLELKADIKVEVEGIVTRFVSINDFDVNGVTVQTNASTKFKHGASDNLSLNILLEVKGVVNKDNILVAEDITFKDSGTNSGSDSDKNEVKLKDIIQNISIETSELTVSDKKIVFDTSTLMIDKSRLNVIPLTFNDLGVGDKVDIRGFSLSNGKILATRLERDDAKEVSLKDEDTNSGDDDEKKELKLEDTIQNIFIESNELMVSDKKIVLDAATLMIDKSKLNIIPLTLNDLGVGDKVDIRGSSLSNGKILATRLERGDAKEVSSKDDDTNSGDDDEKKELKLEDTIQNIFIESNELMVSDKKIILDAATLMIDKSELKITPLTLNDLEVGDKVDIRGFLLSNENVLATKLERSD